MKQDIVVPTIGESITSGILTQWLVQAGQAVSEGDELFELETDKATMAVPATVSGVIAIDVEPDTEVEVGQVVGQIDGEAQATVADQAGGQTAGQPASGTQGASTPASVPSPVSKAPEKRSDDASLSPAVRRLVTEHGLDPGKISGSGKGGRILKEDVLRHLNQRADQGGSTPPQSAVPKAAPPATISPEAGTSAGKAEARQTREPMSRLRKTIADNLVRSKQEAAHLTTFNEVDMSEVMKIRAAHRESFEKRHGVRLGFMSFFVKAAVRALQEFPHVNALIDGTEVVNNHFYDIGVAVSTEKGLVVPVVRDADVKGFGDIEIEILDLATRARDRRLSVDEMTGGTFTITNGGVFGSLLSTPIPNPPQTAVLGMHTIQKRPVVRDDQIVARPMMYVALTYDHRVIDGREAVSFLVKIKNLIEDPTQILLDL